MTHVLHLWKADNGGRYPPQPAKARGRGLAIAGAIVIGVVGLGIVGILVEWLIPPFHFNIGNGIKVPPPSSYGMNMVLSPDGTTAYVTEPAYDQVRVIDVPTGIVVASVAVGDTPSGLALSSNGKELWVVNTGLSGLLNGASGAVISVIATDTNKVIGTVSGDSGAIDVAFSPDGTKAYVTNNGVLAGLTGGASVSVIDTATLLVVGTLDPIGHPFTSAGILRAWR